MDVRPGYKLTEAGVIPEEWDCVKLGDLISLQRGHDLTWRDRRQGDVPVMGSAGQSGCHDTAIAKAPGVVLGRSGASFGQAHYCKRDFWPHNTALYVTDFRDNDPLFIFYFLKSVDFSRHNSGGAQQSLNRNFISPIAVGVPKPREQRVIAVALSDVDALLGGLDRLIAKKRDLKQAAMQQLLTGQTRLPGFSGKWEVKALAQIASMAKGTQLHSSETKAEGQFPHFNGGISPSGFTDKVNMPADTIAISEGGNSCGYVQFISTPFWCGGHCYAVVPRGVDKRFLYHALKGRQSAIMGLRVGSGLPNVQKSALAAFILIVPSNPLEQATIAAVLSDMDAELAALEARRAKTGDLKQAMMQELLTGNTRIVPAGAAHA